MRWLRDHRRTRAAGPLALLLGVVLLAGTVEVHGTETEHSALDRPSVVFTDARHPAQPAHLETSAEQVVPRCSWCVLHAQSLGAALGVPARLVGPAPAATAVDPTSSHRAGPPRLPPVSRGPPLA